MGAEPPIGKSSGGVAANDFFSPRLTGTPVGIVFEPEHGEGSCKNRTMEKAQKHDRNTRRGVFGPEHQEGQPEHQEGFNRVKFPREFLEI